MSEPDVLRRRGRYLCLKFVCFCLLLGGSNVLAAAQDAGTFAITDIAPNPVVEAEPASVFVRTTWVPLSESVSAAAMVGEGQLVSVPALRITERLLIISLDATVTDDIEGVRITRANGASTVIEPIDRVLPTTGQEITQAWVDDLEDLRTTYTLEIRAIRASMIGASLGASQDEAEALAVAQKETVALVRDQAVDVLDALEEKFKELLKQAAIPGSEANQRINDGKALTHFREELFDASAEAMAALIDERVPVTTRSAIDLHYLHPPTIDFHIDEGMVLVTIQHLCPESLEGTIQVRIERVDVATGAVLETFWRGSGGGHNGGSLTAGFPEPPIEPGTKTRVHWDVQCDPAAPHFGDTDLWEDL